jgi:hypothetical protein
MRCWGRGGGEAVGRECWVRRGGMMSRGVCVCVLSGRQVQKTGKGRQTLSGYKCVYAFVRGNQYQDHQLLFLSSKGGGRADDIEC